MASQNKDVSQMKFELVPIEKINPAGYNPRVELKPGDPEYESIKASIEVHGLVDPLIWNEANGVLIGGHQRLKILKDEFNVESAWCSVVNISDEKQEKALNLSLNKNMGVWDTEKLKEILFEFQDDEIDDPLRMSLGFTPLEFKELFSGEGDSDGSQAKEIDLKSVFEVVVECKNELEQKNVFEELVNRGMKCRVITL